MSTGLLFGCDAQVAKYVFANYCKNAMGFDRAIGLIDNEKKLVGGVIFQNWNGPNVEMSYYGRNTLTPGIIRCLADFAVSTFDPVRATVLTSKRNKRLMRSLQKIGFKLEGVQHCHYGERDCARNTAVRFVMFRPRINELAGIKDVASAAA